jgi:hypothetical protein
MRMLRQNNAKGASCDIDALESAVLDTLLSGDRPVLAALKHRLTRSEVHSREFSGAGFFTHFAVPASTPPVDARLRTLGGVVADIEGLTRGAGMHAIPDGRRDRPAGGLLL